MIAPMKWSRVEAKILAGVLAVLFILATPARLLADEEIKSDARIEGYTTNVTLDAGSTALMWLLYILVGLVCLSVLFKDAKRTHLD